MGKKEMIRNIQILLFECMYHQDNSLFIEQTNKDSCFQATGMTPLMYAVKDNRTSLLDKLIDLGSDVGARNNVSY